MKLSKLVGWTAVAALMSGNVFAAEPCNERQCVDATCTVKNITDKPDSDALDFADKGGEEFTFRGAIIKDEINILNIPAQYRLNFEGQRFDLRAAMSNDDECEGGGLCRWVLSAQAERVGGIGYANNASKIGIIVPGMLKLSCVLTLIND